MRRPRPRNAKRAKANADRAYGPPAYRDWLHAQPCIVSGVRGDIEAVHVANGGMSRKADWCWTVPMARELHRELHRIGIKSFEAKWDVDLRAAAVATHARWVAHAVKMSVV